MISLMSINAVIETGNTDSKPVFTHGQKVGFVSVPVMRGKNLTLWGSLDGQNWTQIHAGVITPPAALKATWPPMPEPVNQVKIDAEQTGGWQFLKVCSSSIEIRERQIELRLYKTE